MLEISYLDINKPQFDTFPWKISCLIAVHYTYWSFMYDLVVKSSSYDIQREEI